MRLFFKPTLYIVLLLSAIDISLYADTSLNNSFNSNCCNDCGKFTCDEGCNNSCVPCCDLQVKTHVHLRSQGANTARELVGWQWEINKPFMCQNYGAFYVAYEYQRSFYPNRITNQLFGGPTLRFTGSQVANRNPNTDLVADNFGLSRNFVGSVTFRPFVENQIVDFGFFMGLDCWVQNLYFRLHAPVAVSRYGLCGCECVQTTSPAFDSCYVSSPQSQGDVFVSTPTPAIQSLQCALSGNATFGDMQTPWCAGRLNFGSCRRVGLADIDLIFGYNAFNTDCYHLGVYAQMVIPTGPKARDFLLFDPVVGNGGHLEVGLGLSAHAVLWGCETQNLALFFEGNVTTMLRNRQCRLFDFCQAGPFSRYMLLKEYVSNGSSYIYDGNLVSATCFANQRVNVRVDVKGDASLKLAYRYCGWAFDLGYNAYGHSKERIETFCDDCCVSPYKYAFKGTEGVCCFSYPIVNLTPDSEIADLRIFPNNAELPLGSDVPADCPTLTTGYQVQRVKNNASQPNATAYKVVAPNGASNFVTACNVFLSNESPAVTDPNGEPFGGATNLTELATSLENEGFIGCNNQNTFNFLSTNDLNIHSAEAYGTFTHKVFAHWSYTWYDSCGWNPNIGIGGEVEFDGYGRCNNSGNSTRCKPTSLNQWGVWVKGGFSF